MDASKSAPIRTEDEARKYEKVVAEEIPIQIANLPVNGGLPSCVTLFDNFLLCFSEWLYLFYYIGASSLSVRSTLPPTGVRNQFSSLYRYGTARECSAKWEDFKFCLANRGLSEERKEEEWIKRRAEHWAERRIGPSSEDIWEAKKLH